MSALIFLSLAAHKGYRGLPGSLLWISVAAMAACPVATLSW